jgi:hypothetical protein
MVAPNSCPVWAVELESKPESSVVLQSVASSGGFFLLPFVVDSCPVCVLEPKPELGLEPVLEPKPELELEPVPEPKPELELEPVLEPKPEEELFVCDDDPNAEELPFGWDEPNADVLVLLWTDAPGDEEVAPGCEVGDTV